MRFSSPDAWRSLSGAAVKLFLELHTRYHGANNGRLTLSMNEAVDALGLGKATVSRAYAELQEKGFLRLVKEGNWYGRRAHEWRLTTKPTETAKGRISATDEWRYWRPEKQNAVPRRTRRRSTWFRLRTTGRALGPGRNPSTALPHVRWVLQRNANINHSPERKAGDEEGQDGGRRKGSRTGPRFADVPCVGRWHGAYRGRGDMLRRLFGTRTPEAALGLTSTAMNALGPTADLRPFMTAMLAEAEPGDALEAMLVVQMTATHVAMTRAARLSADAKTSAMHETFERSMTRLSRTYLAQLDALKRYRAKAQQTVRVEHVNVFGGGQAIVGDVAHGGERRAT